jgi:hypothetical protein
MKTAITPKELRAILQREFAKSQPRRCWFTCRIPMPFWREPTRSGSPNWDIAEIASCARGCDSLLLHICNRLKRDFDLTPPMTSIATPAKSRVTARS